MMKKLLCSLLLAAVVLAAGCGDGSGAADIGQIELNLSSASLNPRQTLLLVASTTPEGLDVTWESSNPDVATVDGTGLVTAVAVGWANIEARCGDKSAVCRVTVSKAPFASPKKALAQKMNEGIIFSKNVPLRASTRIMQGFDFLDDGTMFYTQAGSANYVTLNICRAPAPSQPANSADNTMVLKHFGHGTQIVAERAADGRTYIWLNSNASMTSSGYSNNWTFSRVEFVPGVNDTDDGYAGDTFFLSDKVNNSYDLQVAIDFEARRLLVGSRRGQRFFWVYDLDEVLALPLKYMTCEVSLGEPDGSGESTTNTRKQTRSIRARDLADATLLGSFSITAGTDKETEVYSYSHQGHEIAGDYIYFYEGNAVDDGNGGFDSYAYVTVFDYNGKIVMPRTKVVAVSDRAGLAACDLTASGYAEGECLKVKNKKLYLGLGCRGRAGSESVRYADILMYDCLP